MTDPKRAEQEAHPIFQKFLADRERPEHCWYCSAPLTEPPWGPWVVSFIKQKLTIEGKQKFGEYTRTHDADARRQVIPALRGLELPRCHHACDYIDQCERYPQTVEELEERWDEADLQQEDEGDPDD